MSNDPVIQVPRDDELRKRAHDFHLQHVGEFLLPRDIKEFDKLAEDGELWVALVGGDVVATCYVHREDGGDAEFGGIIVRPDYEGTGLGSAMGTVAISAYALTDVSPRLVAHVHIDNLKPVPLLTGWLGFTKLDGEPAQLEKAILEARLGHSINMRADDAGFIRGHTFLFAKGQLSVFADRLATGKLAKRRVRVENRYFQPDRNLTESVAILRGLANPTP